LHADKKNSAHHLRSGREAVDNDVRLPSPTLMADKSPIAVAQNFCSPLFLLIERLSLQTRALATNCLQIK
jgi:hypothetical protein